MKAHIKLGRVFWKWNWLSDRSYALPYTTVEQAMRPLDRLPAVTPETAIIEALEIMDQEKVNELPIAKDGRIEGFITRGGVMRLLQTRAALEM